MELGKDPYKLPIRCDSGSKVVEAICDAPSFSLGPEFDMQSTPTECLKTVDPNSSPAAHEQGSLICGDKEFDELEEACIAAERNYTAKEQVLPSNKQTVISPRNFHTPAKLTHQVEGGCSSASSKSSSAPQLHVRRLMKPPAFLQSPYDTKKQYTCSLEVNRLYALVLLRGRRKSREPQQEDTRLIFSSA